MSATFASQMLPAAERPSELVAEIYRAINDYEHCVKEQAWEKLPVVISRLLGLAELTCSAVNLEAELSDLRHDELRAMLAQVSARRRALQSKFEHATSSQRQQILAALQSSSADPADKARAQAILEGAAPASTRHLTTSFAREARQQTDLLIKAHLRARSIAREARFALYMVAAHHESAKPERRAVSWSRKDRAAAASLGERMQHEVDEGFAQLYRDLRERGSRSQVVSTADRVATKVAVTHLLGATTLGNVLALLDASVTLDDSHAALGLTAQARRMSLLSTYCDFLRVHAAAGGADAWYEREVKAAQAKDVASVRPLGKPVSAAEALALRPADTLLKLEGYVKGLVLAHGATRGKYSSVFELDDGSRGSIPIRAHMFNLSANGLEDGAYCEVHGRVIAEGEWEGGRVGVELDRLSLTEQRKTSWLDDVTYRMRDYFILYLDEMNMAFTPRLTRETQP